MKTFVLSALALAAICCGCQLQNEKAELGFYNATTDSISVTGLSGNAVKLVKTADIECEVVNVQQGLKTVSALAQRYGGAITHQAFRTTEAGRKELPYNADSVQVIAAYHTTADLTVRVPAAHLEAFLFGVGDAAAFVHSSGLDIDDKSLDYLSTALKVAARKGLAATTPTPISTKAVDAALQRQDETIDKEIANREIDAAVRYSTVQLALVQPPTVRKAVVANTNVAAYRLPFGERLTGALAAGWRWVVEALLVLAHLWGFILLGFALWVGWKRWGKRGEILVKG